MGDIGEDEDFGMTGEEGLRDGEFDGKAGVVFAVDEECGYLKLLEDMGARGAAGHAELGCDDALGLGFETLVAEVFDFLFKEGLFAWVEEVGDKVDDVAGAVGFHRCRPRRESGAGRVHGGGAGRGRRRRVRHIRPWNGRG